MDWQRIIQHLLLPASRVQRYFGAQSMQRIEAAISDSETRHSGEICFVVAGSLHIRSLLRGQSAREHALEVFSELRIWDTEHNNGLLLYLLLADHDIEIVADRGIAAKVTQEQWETICQQMEADFHRGEFETGVISGLQQLTRILAEHFPPTGDRRANELSDKPLVL
jgi:uncharacterized membrane protein